MAIFEQEKINQIKAFLSSAERVVIVSHKSPDGDSVGSSVGLYHYLKSKGIKTWICHPDPAPYFLNWMEGSEAILNNEIHASEISKHIAEASAIFCLDFNTMSRAGSLEHILIQSSAKKILIDHHLNPNLDEFDIVFSDISACSTAQLVADFIEKMDDNHLLNEKIGEALYCGIMTDSGSFRYSSVSAHTHEVVANLMKNGLRPFRVHEAVYDVNTLEKKRLWSFAIQHKLRILEPFQTAIISLEKKELEQFNYVKGYAEGLVNEGLTLIGIKKSIFLLESEGIIKISFRSKGEDNPVNEMASNYFQGGGHANAAGGKWEGSMAEAIEEIIRVLPKYC